nr:HAMP domain-containing sensor histidine kinase [uncultured Acetatifactor sp.]
MKKRYFIIIQLIVAAVETILLFGFALQDTDSVQDAVAVNEVLQSVEADWDRLESHENRTGLAYVVLDDTGEVLYRTDTGLSESINAAVVHRDTILDVESGGLVVGKLILSNDSAEFLKSRQQTVLLAVMALMLVQWSVCIGYGIYLDRIVVRPFRQLKDFARRVAGGNLDIPLAMDRGNLFGAFTESFDIMRDELKKARLAEAKANAEKKELVAKLSHDIRTPVASIKAASEVGAALAENDRIKGNYGQIIRKADQIDTLVNNLFTAALEELEQLTVAPVDMESRELAEMLESADYFGWAKIPPIPECLLYGDRLRLQQVFDNIFANAYKYGRGAFRGGNALGGNAAIQESGADRGSCQRGAGLRGEPCAEPERASGGDSGKASSLEGKIYVTMRRENRFLAVCIEDCGGGVDPEELPLLKEKFRRGSNAGNKEGAGLGLYISDYFLREMGGELLVENGEKGLRVTVAVRLSGS